MRPLTTHQPPAAASPMSEWSDDRNNRIVAPASVLPQLNIAFRGHDCLVDIHPQAKIGLLKVEMHGSGSEVHIGAVPLSYAAFAAHMRIGEACHVRIGDGVTTAARMVICASEGASVTIGEDCMIATDVQIRTDDAHPIFDVRSGQRVNTSKDVVIGKHVWLAYGARCLGGSHVGDGSVIGMGSIVTSTIPNNCVAAGIPSRVIRRDAAWERDHLALEPVPTSTTNGIATRRTCWQLTQD